MRLRENRIYLKLTTRRDLLDDGTFLGQISALEDLAGVALLDLEDLQARRKGPRFDDQGNDALSFNTNRGLNQCARLRLTDAERSVSWELHANAHPYSGAHVTQVDVRFPAELAASREGADRITTLFKHWVTQSEPLVAHAHDVDDNAIQNIENPAMLKLGFGLEVETIVLAENPGREESRGEFRLCANWLTWIGAELEELLADHLDADALPPHELLAGGRLFRLSERPEQASDPEVRDKQRELRRALGLREAAEALRRNFGFWQRRR